MKQSISIIPLLILSVFLILASSCEKDDNESPSSSSTAVFNPNITYGSMTDQDRNVYKTVTIGAQTWMAENLRTTKYKDGTAIPNITLRTDWGALTTGAYCNYNNTTSEDTIATYGRMYNWYAINTGKLAPDGWHVATDAEWTTLVDYVGGDDVAGEKLRESGKLHWDDSPYVGGINEFGFTSLPGGSRDWNGTYSYVGSQGFWWTATEYDTEKAYLLIDYFNDSDIYREKYYKLMGYSIRCVKD